MSISGPTEVGLLTSGHSFTIPSGGIPAGSLVVCRLLDGASGSPTYAATDSRSNAYTGLTSVSDGSTSTSYTTIYSLLTTALQAGDTISFTRNGSTGFGPIVRVTTFTGVTGTTDGTQSATAGTAAWTTGSITTANANDLLISGCGWSHTSAVTDTPASGWTDEHNDNEVSINNFGLLTQYQIVSATGTYTGGGTFSSAVGSAAQIVAFEGSGGGGSPTPLVAPVVPQAVNRSLFY